MKNNEIFKIDEVRLYDNKYYCIYTLSEIVLGKADWIIYNDNKFISYNQAEEWLREHLNNKKVDVYI